MSIAKPKSRRRWVRDASVEVAAGGTFGRPALLVLVSPIGKPEETVSFEMEYWQFARLRREAAEIATKHANEADRLAANIREQGGVTK